MKIALLGYGNMGKEVERVIGAEGKHEVVGICLKSVGDIIHRENIAKADVVIDFTSPEIVLKNIGTVARLNKNIVVGTTGWYDKLKKIEEVVEKNNIGLIYAQNFSVGANIFFKTVAFASQLMAKFGHYDVYGYEIHHTGKKDSPSGTALKIGQEVLNNFPAKKSLQTERLDRKINPEEMHFVSIRGGRNPGFHQVTFDSVADSISLSHAAHNRQGFAEGAVLAAEYIQSKKGIHHFDEVFNG
jgi:4-hydroxy-tetrahydrodipicolinate reductase